MNANDELFEKGLISRETFMSRAEGGWYTNINDHLFSSIYPNKCKYCNLERAHHKVISCWCPYRELEEVVGHDLACYILKENAHA